MPKIGDTVRAKDAGKSGFARYIWQACSGCGDERWVRITYRGLPSSTRCLSCAMGQRVVDTDKKRRDDVKIGRDYRARHPSKSAQQQVRHRDNCKYEVIKYYSNGTMSCACCGENHYEFLCIDHINGGGSAMRRKLGHGNMAKWLKARNFPPGYRILCHNCNMSLGFYGYCPHQPKDIKKHLLDLMGE